MEIIPPKFRKAWSDHEVSILVLVSLLLQIFLIFFSLFRQRRANYMLSLLLWSSYLGADYVATLALGNLLNQQNEALEGNTTGDLATGDLAAFWAPFLLLHLGGPDTITSYSLEDNQLWRRHLLGLILQVSFAIFIFLESLPSPHLWQAGIVVFAAGILKFGERTWSLRSASMDQLRESMLSEHDPGPNYVKFRHFTQEYRSRKNANLESEIRMEKEPLRPLPVGETTDIEEEEIVFQAHSFFQTFKRLTVNLMLSFQDRIESQNFFLRRSFKQAFQVVETELSLLHDMLHTKAVHVHNGMGRTMRFLSFSMASVALVLFYRADKKDFKSSEIRITYILLVAALALEGFAIFLLVFSDWTIVSLQHIDRLSHPWIAKIKEIAGAKKLARLIVQARRRVLGEIATRRWSNSMMQYNLIGLCLRDYKPARLERFVNFLRLKHTVYIWLNNKWNVWVRETWDGWFHKKLAVSDDLKYLIFDELRNKVTSAQLEASSFEATNYKRLLLCRGQWVLRETGYTELDWSVKKEFDESILLWHIATHLCYIDYETQFLRFSQGAAATVMQEENKNIPTIWKRISQAMRMIVSGFAKSKRMIREGLSYAIGWWRKIWTAAEPDKDLEKNQPSTTQQDGMYLEKNHREISKNISEYMMFLVVFKPSMLPAGIGKLRFLDTIADTMNFLNYRDNDISEAVATNVKAKGLKLAAEKGASANSIGWKGTLRTIGSKVMEIRKRKDPNLISREQLKKEKEKAACEMLIGVDTWINPRYVTGDRNKSVLFDACKLAQDINKGFKERPEKKWEVISAVWVEMLCYAAGNCVPEVHAKQLSQGGELLTHVWLLMVHIGIGEQYRIEAGPRAKLFFQG